jgi:hypothetical protein
LIEEPAHQLASARQIWQIGCQVHVDGNSSLVRLVTEDLLDLVDDLVGIERLPARLMAGDELANPLDDLAGPQGSGEDFLE